MKLQEWELTLKCNYHCFYCKLPKIKEETNEEKLKKFMDSLDKNIELFCFGGEPFLHPKVKFIINYLNEIKQPFVFQSNGSEVSVNKIFNQKLSNFNLQISIHPTEVSLDQALKNIKKLSLASKMFNINLRRIDVMYIGKESIKYYKKLTKIFPRLNIYLIPISGFYENESCKYTKEYNELRKKRKDIKFEENFISSLNKYRSEVWQDQCEGKFSTFGKQCPHNYTLYTADLSKYNCCYRERNENGICQHQRCFWM
jgi:pyruvate-formate lyase-activating enzyme